MDAVPVVMRTMYPLYSAGCAPCLQLSLCWVGVDLTRHHFASAVAPSSHLGYHTRQAGEQDRGDSRKRATGCAQSH